MSKLYLYIISDVIINLINYKTQNFEKRFNFSTKKLQLMTFNFSVVHHFWKQKTNHNLET